MKSLSIDKKIGIVVMAILITAFAFITYATNINKANANPQGYIRKVSAAATTTLFYMTPGTATTTAIVDCGLANASATGCDMGALLVMFNASSSVSTLIINQEYSQGVAGNSDVNCVTTPDSCDWYEANTSFVNSAATTTITGANPFDLTTVPQFSFDFASSTAGGKPVSTTNNFAGRIITIQSPVRYTRFVFSLKSLTNGNGAVYWETVNKKQNP